MRFRDRVDAGRQLASLIEQRDLGIFDVVVLGLPRGGVPVAYEVATALDLPLDVIIVRKLGVPSQPELAMGAIGEGGARTIDDDVVAMAAVQSADLFAVEEREKLELERRAVLFRGDRPGLTLKGRTALIIDDGIATGSTARAACQVARVQGAARVLLATPVAPPRAVAELRSDADEVICLSTPELFWAIGEFYFDFTQTSDDEVTTLLARAADRRRESERSRLND
jgi:putative phosphoribosyl transferase